MKVIHLLTFPSVQKYDFSCEMFTKLKNTQHHYIQFPCTEFTHFGQYVCKILMQSHSYAMFTPIFFNPLNPELNPICYLLALLGAHHFLHVSRIRVKSLTLRLLMSYIYGAPILDVSRSHTTTQHSR